MHGLAQDHAKFSQDSYSLASSNCQNFSRINIRLRGRIHLLAAAILGIIVDSHGNGRQGMGGGPRVLPRVA
jgi:hypothetical protein